MVPTRRTLILLVIGFLVLLPGSTSAAVSRQPIGAVSSLTGTTTVKHWGTTEWTALKLGASIYQYDVIMTGRKSKVRITFEDESLLNLGEKTKLQIREHVYRPKDDFRASLFSLLEGKMRVLCKQFSGRGSRFDVRTPTAVVGIRGTEFVVWVVNDELTTVACVENSVTVRNSDEAIVGEVIVGPRHMTSVGKGVPPLPPSTTPDELRKQLDVDTAAYRVPPGSATPAMPPPVPAIETPEKTPVIPRLPAEIIDQTKRPPELPPIPQDPREVTEHRPPVLPGPPPPPGSTSPGN